MLSTTIAYVRSIRRSAAAVGGARCGHGSRRLFSDNSRPPFPPFRPRRRPHENYRPLQIQRPVTPGPRDPLTYDSMGREEIVLNEYEGARDELERDFGPIVADMLRERQRAKRLGREVSVEEYLQMADYMTAKSGSLEDKQGERRAMALDLWDDEDRDEFLATVDKLVEEIRIKDLALDSDDFEQDEEEEEEEEEEEVMQGEGDSSEFGEDDEEDDEEDDDDDDDDDEDEVEVDADGDPIDPSRMAHGDNWCVQEVNIEPLLAP